MREIKFRAWDKEKKRMLEWDKYKEEICQAIPVDCGDEWTERCIVMQFTGLTDKNDKEIYEGDIVKTLKDGNIEVIFQDGVFGCKVDRPSSDEYGTEYSEEFISLIDLIETGYWGSTNGTGKPKFIVKVVGSIYENPELL